MNTGLYIIEYKFHGESKSFIIRTKIRSNADAWHWASCDAGVALYQNVEDRRSKSSPSLKLKSTGSVT